jgi:serralysin
MSYFSEAHTGAAFRGYHPAAPLLHDIAAIQRLYGLNPTAFAGDTVYGFNATAERPWFSAASATSPLIFSVWDAGGSDTFDFSGFSQAQNINLNAGQFSDVGGLIGNVSIADGATIESAVGGSGRDLIMGNGAANYIRGMDGDDSIAGAGGDDDLNGNVGADTVDGGEGRDWVRGGQGNDVVVGGAGDDPHVNGNLGADTVYGSGGADTVYGGQGDDVLFGEDGDDWLSGDLGNDDLRGGPGADRFLFRHGSGLDWVADFNSFEGDRVQLAPGASFVLREHEGHALIDLGSGSELALAGVSVGSLGEWLVYV